LLTHSQAPSLIVRSIETLLSKANSVRNPPPDAVDTLAWFTNTTLYHAWLSPARGNPPICSRFLWYSGPRQDNFGASYIKYARHLEIDIVYLDCSHALFHLTDPLPPVGIILNLTPVGLAMWSLIGQALYDRGSSSLESAISACWEAHPEVSQAVEKGGPITFDLLGELLKTALNFRPDRDVIILLDHVEAMSQDELVLLRNAVQKVLDDQRLQEVAQTRAIVVGKRESKVSFAFKGTADIDENTEYRGELHNELQMNLHFINKNRMYTGSQFRKNGPSPQPHYLCRDQYEQLALDVSRLYQMEKAIFQYTLDRRKTRKRKIRVITKHPRAILERCFAKLLFF
jgi:hypothetical protein